jgi:hypothetical protein
VADDNSFSRSNCPEASRIEGMDVCKISKQTFGSIASEPGQLNIFQDESTELPRSQNSSKWPTNNTVQVSLVQYGRDEDR